MPSPCKDLNKAAARILAFDHVLQQTPIGVALLSLDGIYEAVDDAYCEICGCNEQELLGGRFLHLPSMDSHLIMWTCASDTAGKSRPTHGELQIERHDGSLAHVSFKLVPVWGIDRVQRHLVYATDITQLIQTQKKLQQVLVKAPTVLTSRSGVPPHETARRAIVVKKRRFGVHKRLGAAVPNI